ncbi:MAG: DUF5703 domain-containing protein [Bacteroidota bacterium]|nr:DUF5703 domain-containing protein [Bacteroidota bacterium]
MKGRLRILRRSIYLKVVVYFSFVVMFRPSYAVSQTLPPDILTQLNAYNVSWNTVSTTGSNASMPLGNGDITANVWVENNGDLMMYIGKSDSWSEATRLFKVGRVRIHLDPNPFVPGKPFNQTLNLYGGEINIAAGAEGSKINLKVWIDANNPVIRVEATGDQNFTMKCSTELLRPNVYTLSSGNDPLASSFRGVISSPLKPTECADVLMSKPDRIEWYHRDTTSFFKTILVSQNLSSFAQTASDPYMNRTFGAALLGDGLSKVDDTSLQSTQAGIKFSVSIYAYTAQTAKIDDWDSELSGIVSQTGVNNIETLRTNHYAWWDAFWNRSWIFLSGDADAISVTRGYLLQRFMMACQGRGKYPVKFNGGSLTFDYNKQNGDYRNWGPGYWNQNNRHLYWPLLASGDFDLMKPWFDCYMNMLGIQTAVTKRLYNHDGAFFPETFNFFGLFIQDDWGWNNVSKTSDTQWIRYHYSGALDVLTQMLDYYHYTRDETSVTNYIVPYASQVIRFFDKHWARVNGIIKFYPANAIEEYWNCTNPTDYIAGLRYTIPRLTGLPNSLTTQALRDEWNGCLNALPPITQDSTKASVLPAQLYGTPRNSENPECYTIFPYRIYGIGHPDINVGIKTFANRLYKWTSCWSQDPIQAPLLGLTDLAKQDLIGNSKSVDAAVRFPGFWAPKSDYIPDFDNGGTLMMGLENMLIQNVGDSIYILPSFPSTWTVDYKLLAPENTTVRLKSAGYSISQLDVSPESRRMDVVQPSGKQSQYITFPAMLTRKPGDSDFNPGATALSGLNIAYTSSNPDVATIVNGKVHVVGVGTTEITAIQPGNNSYFPSQPEIRKLTVDLFSSNHIEAEHYSGQSGVQTEGCSEGTQDVDFIGDGDYTFYNNVDLGDGSTSIYFRVASSASVGSAAGTIEVRLGGIAGTLIGSVAVPGTGGWQKWVTIPCTLIPTAKGVQNLYLVFRNNSSFNLNWLEINTPLTGVKSVLSDQDCILYPNPATNMLTVVLPQRMQAVNSKINVNIYDPDGRKLKCQTYSLTLQKSRVNVSVDGLKAGTYYLALSDERFIQTKKFAIK